MSKAKVSKTSKTVPGKATAMPAAANFASSKKSKDYQALSLELEEVLAALQESGIQIDQATKLYKQGLELIALLEERLDQAENTIKKLTLAAAADSQEV